MLGVGKLSPAKTRTDDSREVKIPRLSKRWKHYLQWYDYHEPSIKGKGYKSIALKFNNAYKAETGNNLNWDTVKHGIEEAKRLIKEAGQGRMLVPIKER